MREPNDLTKCSPAFEEAMDSGFALAFFGILKDDPVVLQEAQERAALTRLQSRRRREGTSSPDLRTLFAFLLGDRGNFDDVRDYANTTKITPDSKDIGYMVGTYLNILDAIESETD